MQFLDLKSQYERLRSQIQARINQVLEHGQYIMGAEVGELEAQLVAFTGAAHCVTCSSGTDALLMALLAMGIRSGDTLVTTPFTFIATTEVMQLLGVKIVFADIDPQTFNIDTEQLGRILDSTPDIAGIVSVDLFGQPVDYASIAQLARQHGCYFISDAAQSFGASYQNRKVGTLADITTTSFFPAKPLGCYGDGGAIFCQDVAIAEKLRSIRVHGQGTDKYDNVRVGINGRLDTIQAAILLEKLKIFAEEIDWRNEKAAYYSKHLGQKYQVPLVRADCRSVWAQYSLMGDDRAEAMAKLRSKNIPTAIYYPKPLHLQTVFRESSNKPGDFPVAESVSQKIFSLPMHPYLSQSDQDLIIETLL